MQSQTMRRSGLPCLQPETYLPPKPRKSPLNRRRKLPRQISSRYALNIRPMRFRTVWQRNVTPRTGIPEHSIFIQSKMSCELGFEVANVTANGPFWRSPLHLFHHCVSQPFCQVPRNNVLSKFFPFWHVADHHVCEPQ